MRKGRLHGVYTFKKGPPHANCYHFKTQMCINKKRSHSIILDCINIGIESIPVVYYYGWQGRTMD